MDIITLTKTEFLDKFERGEYNFISESDNYGVRSFSMRGNLINEYDPKFHDHEFLEVSHFICGIKLIYYLPVDVVSEFLGISYIRHDDIFEITDVEDDIYYYKVPDKVTLYCDTTLDQYMQSIQKGYDMILSASTNSILFTNDDVFANLKGRLGDIYENIQNGINNMLAQNNINTRIILEGSVCNILF